MTDEPEADRTLIARQQRQLLNEMGTISDDLAVLVAIVQRLDGTVSGHGIAPMSDVVVG